MKHMKEPWIIEDSGYDGIGKISVVGGYIADVDGNTIEQIMANTKRIVACVNACAGITNEALEAGYIQECVDWAKVGKVHNDPKFRGIKVFEEDV